MKLKNRIRIASLSPIQLKKLRDYEKEMEVILVAYEKEKSDRNGTLGNSNVSLDKNRI
jgi:hypothetical protein